MAAIFGINELNTACSGRTLVRLLISGPDGQERDCGVLTRPYLLIGRSPQCDIQLNGSDVSHRHAYIQLIGDRIFCADLGSRTGVHWPDGKRPLSWVAFNEHLAIGPYGLRFVSVCEPAAPETQTTALSRQHRPAVSLRFLNARVNTDHSRQWQLRRSVTLLGHLPSCHLPLLDASVSRVHASLLRTPQGVWVIDLLGKGGVEVNGERVAFARLTSGDELKVGRFRMAVEQTLANESISSDPQFHDLTLNTLSVHANTEPPNPPAQQPAEGLSAALVMSLLNQSASMQQQMAAQQQQMMLLTMQMLSAMQGQHAKLIREELKVIKSLTDEIQQIRTTLAEQAAAAATRREHEPEHESAQVILPLIPPAAKTGPALGRPRQPDMARRQAARAEGVSARVAFAKHTSTNQPEGLDGDALQAHLANRLAELERKRSGYWYKITRVMMG